MQTVATSQSLPVLFDLPLEMELFSDLTLSALEIQAMSDSIDLFDSPRPTYFDFSSPFASPISPHSSPSIEESKDQDWDDESKSESWLFHTCCKTLPSVTASVRSPSSCGKCKQKLTRQEIMCVADCSASRKENYKQAFTGQKICFDCQERFSIIRNGGPKFNTNRKRGVNASQRDNSIRKRLFY